MPERRDQIRMSETEVRDFLAEGKVMTLATLGPRGRPHLMPLWYVPDGERLRGWTYAASQKARNLGSDPRATVQVEAGVAYHELRGAMLECDVELTREVERVVEIGVALFERYGATGPEVRQMVEKQAPKRVRLDFSPTRVITWDHRKLGGVY